MYLNYFGFRVPPFSISPDPRFIYLSASHRDALAHLVYGARESGGFVLLTGEVGTGKTTLCRNLLQQMPAETDIAFIVNPRQNSIEILQSVCDELGVPYYRENESITLKHLVDCLNDFLLESHRKGRNTIVIIDEAQNLSVDVLEQLRLLTNLETSETKLLRLILLGQPELRDILARPELRQLAQRITARYHLEPLNRKDVASYINHRLTVAGFHGDIFSSSAIRKIHLYSAGIPRLVNILCDRALLGLYARQGKKIDGRIINQAVRELSQSLPQIRQQHKILFLIVMVVVLAAIPFFVPVDQVVHLYKKLSEFSASLFLSDVVAYLTSLVTVLK